MKCKTCKHWFDNGTDYSSCDRDALLRESDFFCAAWEEEPIERVITVRESPTNADRIRDMTDEELATWMAINTDCFYCKIKNKNICSLAEGTCIEEWRFWLKSPVEVDNGT